MGLKRSWFSGYTRGSVRRVMSEYQREIEELQQLLQEKERLIDSLQSQISNVKSQDQLIEEAALDAKMISNHILNGAQQKADGLLTYVEESISEQISRLHDNLSVLKQSNQALLDQEKGVRHELRHSLNVYLQLIDQSSKKLSDQGQEFYNSIIEIEDRLNKIQSNVNFESIKKQKDMKSRNL